MRAQRERERLHALVRELEREEEELSKSSRASRDD
jgi:hypothetical protein